MKKRVETNLYKERAIKEEFDGVNENITETEGRLNDNIQETEDRVNQNIQDTEDRLNGNIQDTEERLEASINIAIESADGKSKIFHQASAPTSGMKTNDVWFDTDDGYKMYRYDGTSWVAEQFGTNALANLSITNAKIVDGTIQSAKISSIDAGKITTGTLTGLTITGNDINIGGLNNSDGELEVFDNSNVRVGRWDKDGLYLGNIASSLSNPNMQISTDGQIYAYDTDMGTAYMGFGTVSSTQGQRQANFSAGLLHITSPTGDTDGRAGTTIYSNFNTNKYAMIDTSGAFGSEFIMGDLGAEGTREEYIDYIIKRDATNVPLTEFAKDPRWTEPSNRYLATMLIELLKSARFLRNEEEAYDTGPYMGHLTNALKDLNVFFPHYKNADGLNLTTANVTLPTALIVRTTGGTYLNGSGSSGIPKANLTVKSVTHRAGGFNVVFGMKDGSAFTSATNNTPVSVMVSGTMKIKLT